MDKNAIKKYAVWARRELIARVSQKAEQYGVTEKEIIDERAESIRGVLLTPAQIRQRMALIALIRYDNYLPFDDRARWIITSNFAEIWIYDRNQTKPDPVKVALADLPSKYHMLDFLVKKEVKHVSDGICDY